MSRLFWNEGGVFNLYAESPVPVPALGRVVLEHAPAVPRQSANGDTSVASENQHSVAVAVEPVPPLHGISIDGEDLLAARKRRHQDQ